jgi:integral membrane protein (TIGR01906 family)
MQQTARITIILTLPLVLLFTSLEVLVFNPAYFNLQFSRYNIEEATGMAREDLLYTMGQVMGYLKGERDDLVVLARVRGEEREIFGQREKDHMVDVRHLFLQGFRLRNAALALLLPALGFLLYKKKGGAAAAGLAWAGWLPLLLILVLGLLAALDFSRYFVLFHEVFFDNDLWLLDPEKEILIQMLPEGFFRDTAFLWGGLFACLSFLTGLFSFRLLKTRFAGQGRPAALPRRQP